MGLRMGFIVGFVIGAVIAALTKEQQPETNGTRQASTEAVERGAIGDMKRLVRESLEAAREAKAEKEEELRRQFEASLRRSSSMPRYLQGPRR